MKLSANALHTPVQKTVESQVSSARIADAAAPHAVPVLQSVEYTLIVC